MACKKRTKAGRELVRVNVGRLIEKKDIPLWKKREKKRYS